MTFDRGHVPRPHYQPVSRTQRVVTARTDKKRDSFCSCNQVRHVNPSVNLQTVGRKLGFRPLEIQFVVYTVRLREFQFVLRDKGRNGRGGGGGGGG